MKTAKITNRINFLMMIFYLIGAISISAQTTVFSDNFESGTTKWVLTGSWGLSTSSAYSTTRSLSESPTGNYTDNQNTSATSISINLSTYLGAELSFWAKHNLENAFDYMFVEISNNGGTSFVKLKEFTGIANTWTKYTYNLGTFAGYSNVKIRFRFYSDQYINADGMYIDDVTVKGLNIDQSEPLIVHQGPEHYQGTLGDVNVSAYITDVSGVNSTTLFYITEGAGPFPVNGTYVSGNQYSFTIPAQSPGKSVSYKIRAIDKANPSNQTDTSLAPKHNYISGSYLAYDNGVVDAVATITGITGTAVKISVPNGLYGFLVTALIRNYTDPNITNSNMLFHVWANNNGVPGVDLITPFLVTPEATQNNPFPFTRIDLRSYSTQLSDLTGDFFIGYTVPTGSASMVVSNTANSRSFSFNGTTWSAYAKSYEMRAIINESVTPLPVELTTFNANVEKNSVNLIWETATEVNNYGFEIERASTSLSMNSSEAATKFIPSGDEGWEMIGFVEGNGNSNSPKYYQYSDKNLSNSGKYLYRLKQIDIDGQYEYSDKVEVNILAPEEFTLSQNYPNPFNPTTMIKYSIPEIASNLGDSKVTLKIYDILGKEVTTLVNESKQAGSYEVEFNAEKYPSGLYFYTISAGNFNLTRKMLLIK